MYMDGNYPHPHNELSRFAPLPWPVGPEHRADSYAVRAVSWPRDGVREHFYFGIDHAVQLDLWSSSGEATTRLLDPASALNIAVRLLEEVVLFPTHLDFAREMRGAAWDAADDDEEDESPTQPCRIAEALLAIADKLCQ